MKNLFVCAIVEKKHDIEVFGRRRPLDLIWADGMVGVMPVFASQKDAEEYCDNQVFEIDILSAEEKKTEANP